jgi:hypothetical protein
MRLSRIAACLILLLAPCAGKAAPAPYGGSSAVYNDPAVAKQFEACWQADANGTLRDGTWEYGFRIDYVNGKLVPGPLVMGDQEYRVLIPCTDNTVAVAHVHPNSGVSTPSKVDMDGGYPDYVISRDGLCLTNPKTHTYQKLKTFGEMFKPAHKPRKHKA